MNWNFISVPSSLCKKIYHSRFCERNVILSKKKIWHFLSLDGAPYFCYCLLSCLAHLPTFLMLHQFHEEYSNKFLLILIDFHAYLLQFLLYSLNNKLFTEMTGMKGTLAGGGWHFHQKVLLNFYIKKMFEF
jgi:hypothetical protein